MNDEIEIPTIVCPKCGNKSLELHGEGITSFDEHYPMEICNKCGYSPASFDQCREPDPDKGGQDSK